VGTGATFQLVSTTTSLTVFTLDPYTTYVCIIAAVTSVGIGPFSNPFTLSTPEDGKSWFGKQLSQFLPLSKHA